MEDESNIAAPLYEDPVTRQRFAEFLGGERLEEATAAYITHSDGCSVQAQEMKPPSQLTDLLKQGCDIDRSLMDHQSLLVHLDIEYVNFDSPAECFIHPRRCFKLQDPVIRIIEEELLLFGIRPLHILTGQGHHFIWRLDKSSQVITRLVALSPASPPPPTFAPDPAIQAGSERWKAAFSGLGLVMEFLAGRIKRLAAPACSIPVEVTAQHIGRVSTQRREMISVDISEYGDPLWTRVIRLPFSNYLKHRRNCMAQEIKKTPTPIFTIPLHEIDAAAAIKLRTHVEETRELAQRACVRIPEQSAGMDRLIEQYRNSPLRVFHRDYEQAQPEPDAELRKHLGDVPPCARHVIEYPNDLLLKPTGMKLITRCLMALGIPPSQIARMIARTFRNPSYDWKDQWVIYSPEMRAQFYTRVFAGQIVTGLDQQTDFNCVSLQEQGFCFDAMGCNLKPWKDRLLSINHQSS